MNDRNTLNAVRTWLREAKDNPHATTVKRPNRRGMRTLISMVRKGRK